MTQDESNLPPGDPVHEEPLSPTGMFRRVFEQHDENAATPHMPADLSVQGGPAPSSSSPEPGEFTRLFQRVQPSSSAVPGETAATAATPPDAGGAGEFTRIFLSGSGGRTPEDAQKPGTDAVSVGQRGFSSPGRTGSAAAEGSVIQLFHAPSTMSPAPLSPPEVEASPAASTPGITHLLESLSAPDRPPSEPVPFSPQSPPASPVESAGVTQFIQKLGEDPVVVRETPPPPAAPPGKSGPGEYTRVVARLEENPVASAAADSAVAKALLGRPPVPALPAAPIVATPPAQKPPAATAPKKTTLETIAPLLLALNTILLVAVLLLLILLLRSR